MTNDEALLLPIDLPVIASYGARLIPGSVKSISEYGRKGEPVHIVRVTVEHTALDGSTRLTRFAPEALTVVI